MGNFITLICDETPGLTLGPGDPPGYKENTDPTKIIRFIGGFAEFAEEEHPDWRQWVSAPGTPHIEIVEQDSGQVPATYELGFDCPTCGKAFGTQQQLNGHRLHHRVPVG